MLVRFEIIRAFELASHTKEMANKKAKTAFVSTLLARKNSPKTSGVRIKIAPSFAKTTLHKAHKMQSAMKRAFALMMSVFGALRGAKSGAWLKFNVKFEFDKFCVFEFGAVLLCGAVKFWLNSLAFCEVKRVLKALLSCEFASGVSEFWLEFKAKFEFCAWILVALSLNLSLWQSFSTAKISHSKKPKACKQRLMMMSAMRVKQLSQMSENMSFKSCKLTSLRAIQAAAPTLENTQILSLKGRVKIPKSVSKKMMSASIYLLVGISSRFKICEKFKSEFGLFLSSKNSIFKALSWFLF